MTSPSFSFKTAIEQIAGCKFECEGGPLENNVAWRWLVNVAKDGLEFLPGQGVYYEVSAEAAGIKLKQLAHFYIVGCRMESSAEKRFWLYSLSYDPPAPYHYGTVHYAGIPGERLQIYQSNPAA